MLPHARCQIFYSLMNWPVIKTFSSCYIEDDSEILQSSDSKWTGENKKHENLAGLVPDLNSRVTATRLRVQVRIFPSRVQVHRPRVRVKYSSPDKTGPNGDVCWVRWRMAGSIWLCWLWLIYTLRYLSLAYILQVDSVFCAIWLVPLSRNILHYSLLSKTKWRPVLFT